LGLDPRQTTLEKRSPKPLAKHFGVLLLREKGEEKGEKEKRAEKRRTMRK